MDLGSNASSKLQVASEVASRELRVGVDKSKRQDKRGNSVGRIARVEERTMKAIKNRTDRYVSLTKDTIPVFSSLRKDEVINVK